MITETYFSALKSDLLSTYKDQLCEESIEDLNAASNVTELIAVLNKYRAFLRHRSIPDTTWVRKWFGEHAREVEKEGCYIDCTRVVTNPKREISLFGKASVTLLVTEPHVYHVTTHDESRLHISAIGASAVEVWQKDNSTTAVLCATKTATIKITKI